MGALIIALQHQAEARHQAEPHHRAEVHLQVHHPARRRRQVLALVLRPRHRPIIVMRLIVLIQETAPARILTFQAVTMNVFAQPCAPRCLIMRLNLQWLRVGIKARQRNVSQPTLAQFQP